MLRRETPPLAGPLQIFKCFLIHATAGPHARNCPRAKYRQTYPEKTELFRRNKVRRQENMSVSGSGLCEGSIYIFLNFLVLFVSRQKGQLKKQIVNFLIMLILKRVL